MEVAIIGAVFGGICAFKAILDETRKHHRKHKNEHMHCGHCGKLHHWYHICVEWLHHLPCHGQHKWDDTLCVDCYVYRATHGHHHHVLHGHHRHLLD